MKYVWIRRGYGAFVRCKNTAKAKRRAEHWAVTGQGDPNGVDGKYHNVIGMFVCSINHLRSATRTQLYS